MPVFLVVRENHVDNDRQAITGVEHALRAAQTDAHRAVFQRLLRRVGRVGVGHDLEISRVVRPAKQRLQVIGKMRIDGRDSAQVHHASAAIERDDVAFM